ncbi:MULTISPECIES: YjjG family noncanonical pyrimidine nucleotidase [unclassified Granulicatella]|uniref:YjjG family noncanonical pyrimidine nucleotidase n=1 Tax=unclassified Granulicatella TaxID=2630493 RepID=UPI001430E531|nr:MULTISPECIES: YjjG family noncanonical pyrimidine nucleotidase [unclassified Granulicatella]MBF0780132.1 noncanonical pyrimidine nucleotidase, YjjG family [Granulicatella sp. 19428wC4_WM01]
MLKKYKTILFDIDDTLLDFQLAQQTAFKKLLEYFNIPYCSKHYLDYQEINKQLWSQYEQGTLSKSEVLSQRFSLFFKRFNLEIDANHTDVLYRQWLSSGNQLFSDTLHVVQTLAKTHQLAIITNGVHDTQISRLKNNQLYPFFKERIFISDSIGYQKPDIRFFDYVLDALTITDKQSVLIIGDSLQADIYGGNLSQIDTCWITPKHRSYSKNICPTHVISSLSELLQDK